MLRVSLFILTVFVLLLVPPSHAKAYGLTSLNDCHSSSKGTYSHGKLSGGEAFAFESDWHFTWNWRKHNIGNPAKNRFAACSSLDKLNRIVLDYAAFGCPRLAIGDLSKRGGGRFKGHASHQNGKDVDIYYPLKSKREWTTENPKLIDNKCSEILLKSIYKQNPKFVLTGTKVKFKLSGKRTYRYPNHNHHFHVRFR